MATPTLTLNDRFKAVQATGAPPSRNATRSNTRVQVQLDVEDQETLIVTVANGRPLRAPRSPSLSPSSVYFPHFGRSRSRSRPGYRARPQSRSRSPSPRTRDSHHVHSHLHSHRDYRRERSLSPSVVGHDSAHRHDRNRSRSRSRSRSHSPAPQSPRSRAPSRERRDTTSETHPNTSALSEQIDQIEERLNHHTDQNFGLFLVLSMLQRRVQGLESEVRAIQRETEGNKEGEGEKGAEKTA